MVNEPTKPEPVSEYGASLDEQIKALQAMKKQATSWAPVDEKSVSEMVKDMTAIKGKRVELKTLEEALDSKATVLKTRYPDDFLKMVVTDEDVKNFMFGAKPATKTAGGTRNTGVNWYDKIIAQIPVTGINKDELYKKVIAAEPDANPAFIKRGIGNDSHVSGQKLSIPSIISKGMAQFDGDLVKVVNVVDSAAVPEKADDKPDEKPVDDKPESKPTGGQK